MIPINQTFKANHKLNKRDWRQVSKEAWLQTGAHWHRFLLKKHFTRGAIAEYDYEPRAKSTEMKKARKFGHRRPLVFTGELQRMVMRVREVTSVGDGKKGGAAKIKLRGPRYLYQYRKDLGQPDKAAELSAVSTKDADDLAKKLDRVITRELNEESRTVDITKGHRR